MTGSRYHLPETLDRLQRVALLVGVIGLLLGAIGAIFSRPQFFNSYLFAYFFCLGLPLGGLALTMLHHLTGGNWGLAIRRECEAAALTLPLMLVLFLPILVGLSHLFPWANPDLVRGDKILEHQSIYFNPRWFFLRAIIYFAVWIVLAMLLSGESRAYERSNDYRLVRRMRKVSAGGLVLLMLTITAATFDWVMSREAHFYSTIIGFMVAVGMTLSALVLVVALLRALAVEPELRDFLSGDVLNDLGNLMLTLVILWAYMSFAQFLIIWMGNIENETPWYVHRGLGQARSAWRFVGALLLIFHFFAPFLVLLSRDAKRKLAVLTNLALLILLMRAIDVYWLIAPSGPDRPSRVSWMDLPLLLGILGIWFAVFVSILRRRPLVARVEMDEEEAAEAAKKGTQHGGAAGASPAA